MTQSVETAAARATVDPADLKVERIEVVPVRAPLPRKFQGSHYSMTTRCTIVTRVYTKCGIVGESYNGDTDEEQARIVGIIENELTPAVLGCTAFSIERCWEEMLPSTYDILRDRSLSLQAIACVDSALWDSLGKALGVPLYRLWGGYRDRLQMTCIGGYYTDDEADVARQIERYVELGFAGCKFKVVRLSPADDARRVKLAREAGARTLGITNLMGTQITREAEATLYTRCGMEVGVAASKTFTAQVALLSLLALRLAQIRRTLPENEIDFILDQLHELPQKMQEFLDGDHPIEPIAQRFHDAPFFLYLGRHIGLPVALEGALKLKEISYIPTDAYSAGEMKHGPIALLAEGTPVVVVATNIHVYDKIVSNIQETRARGAHVIAIATDGNEDIQHHADDVIYVPRTPNFLQASLAVIPLQLLAYRIARLRGLNVDQPRNLAKTVTVE